MLQVLLLQVLLDQQGVVQYPAESGRGGGHRRRRRHGAVGQKHLVAQRIRGWFLGVLRRRRLRKTVAARRGGGGLGGGDGRHGVGLLLQFGDRHHPSSGVVRIHPTPAAVVFGGHGRGIRRLRLGDSRRRRSCRRAAAEVVLHHRQRTTLIVEGEVLVRERVGGLPGGHGCSGWPCWSVICDEMSEVLCHKKR